MNKAINNITIAKAVDEGYLDEDFFEDTDNPDDLVKRVTIFHKVSIDYQSFQSKMATLNPKDQKLLRDYLSGDKSFRDFSEEMGIDYQSAVKRTGNAWFSLIFSADRHIIKECKCLVYALLSIKGPLLTGGK